MVEELYVTKVFAESVKLVKEYYGDLVSYRPIIADEKTKLYRETITVKNDPEDRNKTIIKLPNEAIITAIKSKLMPLNYLHTFFYHDKPIGKYRTAAKVDSAYILKWEPIVFESYPLGTGSLKSTGMNTLIVTAMYDRDIIQRHDFSCLEIGWWTAIKFYQAGYRTFLLDINGYSIDYKKKIGRKFNIEYTRPFGFKVKSILELPRLWLMMRYIRGKNTADQVQEIENIKLYERLREEFSEERIINYMTKLSGPISLLQTLNRVRT